MLKWILRIGLLLISLLVLGAGYLMARGNRQDAGRMSHAIEINQPPDVVFKWITDPQRQKQWVGWLKEVEVVDDRHAIWHMDDPNSNQRIRIPSEVTQLVPGKSVAVSISMPDAFSGTSSYSLEDLGGGRTRLTSQNQYVYHHWLAKLMEPLVTPEAQKKLETDLASLKRLAESTN